MYSWHPNSEAGESSNPSVWIFSWERLIISNHADCDWSGDEATCRISQTWLIRVITAKLFQIPCDSSISCYFYMLRSPRQPALNVELLCWQICACATCDRWQTQSLIYWSWKRKLLQIWQLSINDCQWLSLGPRWPYVLGWNLPSCNAKTTFMQKKMHAV